MISGKPTKKARNNIEQPSNNLRNEFIENNLIINYSTQHKGDS